MKTTKYIAVLGSETQFKELNYLVSCELCKIIHISNMDKANGISFFDIIYLEGWEVSYKYPVRLREYLRLRIR